MGEIVKVTQGARYITRGSSDNIGRRNYVEKTNWRRVDDAEQVREGEERFRPNIGIAQGTQSLDVGSDILGLWEAIRPNGQRTLVAATRTTLYKFDYTSGTWSTIGSGFSSDAKFWEAESLDGYLILNNGVDLPVTFRAEDGSVSQITEMREAGIAAVGTMTVYNGFMICGDITEINSLDLADWMNGGTPYGIPGSSITNRIRYKITWSDYAKPDGTGGPRNWGPIIMGTIQSATKNKITLDYPFSPAQTVGAKLGIGGAGAGGGMLGGQSGFDDGVTVTVVSGLDITINTTANASLTYPLRVQVQRWIDTSSFRGSSSLQDDSSAVLRLKKLQKLLTVYRETGIFMGRYTGVKATPFVFTSLYAGKNVPAYPRAVLDLEDAHVYPTENAFYIYDGAGDPRIFETLDDASGNFFNGITTANAGRVFGQVNPITKELWFHSINGVLVFGMVKRQPDWIDRAYGASAHIRRPDGTTGAAASEFWFIMAYGGMIVRYGLLDSGAAIFSRLGEPYWASLKGGLQDLGGASTYKDLVGYVPFLASSSARTPIEITLYGGDNAAVPLEVLEDFPVRIEDAGVNPLIELFAPNIYFQDRIRVLVTPNNPVKLVGRQFLEPGEEVGDTRR